MARIPCARREIAVRSRTKRASSSGGTKLQAEFARRALASNVVSSKSRASEVASIADTRFDGGDIAVARLIGSGAGPNVEHRDGIPQRSTDRRLDPRIGLPITGIARSNVHVVDIAGTAVRVNSGVTQSKLLQTGRM
jgi:hypothetical protein